MKLEDKVYSSLRRSRGTLSQLRYYSQWNFDKAAKYLDVSSGPTLLQVILVEKKKLGQYGE